jgi:hypothetical protein
VAPDSLVHPSGANWFLLFFIFSKKKKKNLEQVATISAQFEKGKFLFQLF